MSKKTVILVGLFLLQSACTAIGQTGNEGDNRNSVEASQSETATATVETIAPNSRGETGEMATTDYKDLTVRPQIWFGPLDPWSWDRHFPGAGPFEFYDLFKENAPWQQASDAVHVIRLYPAWIGGYATHQQLETVISDIDARGMAFTFEGGPLQEKGACNASTIEGFAGKGATQSILLNIKTAGGTLYGWDMEHGFDAATYYDPGCRKTPHEIAEDVAITMTAVREIFPDAKIGSIETANLDVNDVAAWMTAYREVVGEELDYFHLDINFSRVDWAERAKEIEDYVRSRGVDFGIIYFGNHDANSDLDWINNAEEHFVEYEVLHGGNPDHVIFQSWNTHPQNLIPETDHDSFTNLILRYLRPRTSISLNLSDGTAAGKLKTEGGNPLATMPVEIFAAPLAGEGLVTEYVVTGTVPEGATHGNVGFRINTECDCAGPAALILDSVSYQEGNQLGGNVPNGNFGNGLTGWGVWGQGVVELVPSMVGNGRALSINATRTQDVGANSDAFAVEPGQKFTVTFTAKVDPKTETAGYFSLFFLNDAGEVTRYNLAIEAGKVTIGSATTNQDGSYTAVLSTVPSGTYEIVAWFPGTDEYWPAIITIEEK
ncbi:MAG: carbohydrate binding domain-containing protein [Anaerolineae bacterium]|nr:carbohydrate binding domain-containing protein [Anaerolineae bacterium]